MEAFKNINPVKVDKAKIINLEKGKLPPSSVEFEQSVLGAMLNDSRGVDECLVVLKSAEVFFFECNQVIFEAIVSLYNENAPVDLLTVSSRLRTMNALEKAGGDMYLIELTQAMASSAHIEWHSRIILQKYIKRRVIMESSRFLAEAYDDDKDSIDLLHDWSGALDAVTELSMQGKQALSYAEGLDQVEKRIEFLSQKQADEITGAHTGFNVINLFTGGYQPGELIIVGARPGMGKTAYVLRTAVENIKSGGAVGFVSAEMSTYQLIARTVAIDTNFHLKQITKTGFEHQEYFVTLSKHKSRMRQYPMYIDDTPSPDIRNVIATARMWKRKYGIKMLIVDYLQLCVDSTKVSKSGNREQEIASISRKLKALAKELAIPVIALSQLSRDVETRGDKRPKLSDLRESGAIEQDADMVQFIYRPEYYGIQVDDEIAATGADTEIIFSKYRGGAPNTTIGLKWIGDKTKFVDPDELLTNMDMHDRGDDVPKVEQLPNMSPSEAFGPKGEPF